MDDYPIETERGYPMPRARRYPYTRARAAIAAAGLDFDTSPAADLLDAVSDDVYVWSCSQPDNADLDRVFDHYEGGWCRCDEVHLANCDHVADYALAGLARMTWDAAGGAA